MSLDPYWQELTIDDARRYDRQVNSQNSVYYERYEDLLSHVVSSSGVKEGDTVLEIGCGTGELTRHFIKHCLCKVTALDPSPGMLEQAKVKATSEGWKGVHFALATDPFLEIPAPDNVFKAVASTFAFHHVDYPDKKKAIAEMVRVLAPGGRLVLGDVMFTDEEVKQLAMKRWEDEIEDEPFTYLDGLDTLFLEHELTFHKEKIGEITWLVWGKKY